MKHLPEGTRIAGTAVPVFSLRSEGSFGVGDFGDLKKMIDWVALTGQKILQILPINDTTATHTWTDSYPYSCISIYALHPQYCDLRQLDKLTDKKEMDKFAKLQVKLNKLAKIDYEAVNKAKIDYLLKLFKQEGEKVIKTKAFKDFVKAEKQWIEPYGQFCIDHKTYPSVSKNDADNKNFVYYIQFILDGQMRSAHEYAKTKGVMLKGDIPIGVSRYGCDAWAEPRYFNMNGQAGAPPDSFSTNGQNWGFPTYNWDEMLKDDCQWWVRRFQNMAKYFDAYRIDHVLGFFRIWEIPTDAVHGLLGHFSPALALSKQDIESYGLYLPEDFMTKPFIADWIIDRFFPGQQEYVKKTFLDHAHDDIWNMKPEFDTQRKVEAWFMSEELKSEELKSEELRVKSEELVRSEELKSEELRVKSEESEESDKTIGNEELRMKNEESVGNKKSKTGSGKKDSSLFTLHSSLKEGLYSLISNVLFVRDHKNPELYHPRIAVQLDPVYETMWQHDKDNFNRLYNDYYYRRNNQFWYEEAMKKLPRLVDATDMLVCAEDLGMVPDCVPWVMNQLQILSLELQSMPKDPNVKFGVLERNPWRSVCTISSHDSATMRMWWDEDYDRTQEYFNQWLGYQGPAPHPMPSWLADDVLMRHLRCPSALCIITLQDWLAGSDYLRLEDANEERINIPANPKHYWRYRMHLNLEELLKADGFNDKLRGMIKDANR